MIRLEGVSKIYQNGAALTVLDDVTLTIADNQYVGIFGPSGSGKSTLLHIIGLLDRPSRGRFYYRDRDVTTLSDDEGSRTRGREIGFIFQSFHLVPNLSVLENVELPLFYQGVPAAVRREKAREQLEHVSMMHRLSHVPSQLSGGERQRTAIARALVTNPSMILADEPTGNLDSKTGQDILAILDRLHADGKTIVMITHDVAIARRLPRLLRINDGRVTEGGPAMKLVRIGEFMVSGARNLLRHKLRSLLTLLGVFFGVAAVITMLGIGEGAQRTVMQEISGLGLRNIIAESVQPTKPAVSTSQTPRRGLRLLTFGLTHRDARQLQSLLSDADVTTTHMISSRVYVNGQRLDAKALGVPPTYFDFFHTRLMAGRPLNDVDENNGHRVVVVSENLAHLYQPENSLARQPIRIGQVYFEVVGVVKQSAQGGNSMIYLPYRTARLTYGNTSIKREAGSVEFTRSELGQIILRVASEDQVPAAATLVRRNLEINHPQGDFKLTVPLEILSTKQRTQRILNLVLIAIAAISLVVGGIGIMNIMLAVVTERIPEIGIRRAIGATREDILYQFLAETVTLSSIGGVLGCLCGFILVPLASKFTGWPGVITPGAVIASLAVSWLVGLVFGMAPAIRASRMDPVEALRYE